MSSDPKSKSPPLAATLYIVATPIGNLADMTFRAVETLKAVQHIACEDTRTTRTLTTHYGITTPLIACHDHNVHTITPHILELLARGDSVALVSDAGTPLISDPGYPLVRAAQDAGYAVVPIPGACALPTALCASGLPTDLFTFAGFLPTKSSARSEKLKGLMALPHTVVLYESPHRICELLAAIAALDASREVAVARELTKRFEEIRRDQAQAIAQAFAARESVKGELVVMISPAATACAYWSQDAITALLHELLREHSVKDAAAQASTLTGLSKSELYQRALALKTTS